VRRLIDTGRHFAIGAHHTSCAVREGFIQTTAADSCAEAGIRSGVGFASSRPAGRSRSTRRSTETCSCPAHSCSRNRHRFVNGVPRS